jgi:SAM-dependent methyltransferase
VVVTNSIFIDDLEIPKSNHPNIKKLKNACNDHTDHGNKVWSSSLVLIDAIKDLNIRFHDNNLVLDLGCGWGVLSSYLALNGANVVGVDKDPNVEPYFKCVADINNVSTLFLCDDFFKKDFEQWKKFIKRVVKDGKQLLMCDPGRESFWELLRICDVPHIVERHYISKPRKTDSYIVIFGE